jgi:tetratricopeptide (TPR) repeat protein
MLQQSAHLAARGAQEERYARALYHLGEACEQLGEREPAVQCLSQAVAILQRVSPDEAATAQATLKRLTG